MQELSGRLAELSQQLQASQAAAAARAKEEGVAHARIVELQVTGSGCCCSVEAAIYCHVYNTVILLVLLTGLVVAGTHQGAGSRECAASQRAGSLL